MRIESRFFAIIAIFFFVVFFLYWFTSYEDAGGVMLFFSILLGALPGSYLLWWSRHMRPRPEDREDALIEEGAGYVGSFPGSSIWPFVLGMGLASIALAMIFGAWPGVVGAVVVLGAFVGVILESRRGGTI